MACKAVCSLGYRHFVVAAGPCILKRGGGLDNTGRAKVGVGGGPEALAGAQRRPSFLVKARQNCPQFGPVKPLIRPWAWGSLPVPRPGGGGA
jgi:hypothetical protein